MKEENKNNEMEENQTEELIVPEADTTEAHHAEEEDPGDFKWYAVRIISGHENKVKAHLDNEIKNEKLGDKIRNVLIPLERIFEVKGGKKKVKLKNFLPGYILIQVFNSLNF